MTACLNGRSFRIVENLLTNAQERRVVCRTMEGGGRVLDCGIDTPGSLQAGLDLTRACLADLASVCLLPGEVAERPCLCVHVITDSPVLACLASQYAGWKLTAGKFFAMGSGPMRAAAASESIFQRIGYSERPDRVVGILEGRSIPSPEIISLIARACSVRPEDVSLLIAPTASLACSVQVVARSVETALHKLAELDFDLSRIISASGTAPLPPIAGDDLAAIGRTNDAVLYGARVILFVTGDDDSLADVGPRLPSCSSRDYGQPFSAIFARYNHDFYAVDPLLFSPAEVVFHNIQTGRSHAFGTLAPEILDRSFYG